MVLDVPIKAILDVIGHDGSDILWPDLPEPIKRRAFHVEELMYACRELGYYLVEYPAKIAYNPGGAHTEIIDFTTKWNQVIAEHSGILLGHYAGRTNAHAVAWNAQEGTIYDPSGNHAKLPEFTSEAFYAAIRSRS